jgi:hypothetical protein
MAKQLGFGALDVVELRESQAGSTPISARLRSQ